MDKPFQYRFTSRGPSEASVMVAALATVGVDASLVDVSYGMLQEPVRAYVTERVGKDLATVVHLMLAGAQAQTGGQEAIIAGWRHGQGPWQPIGR